LYYGLRHYRKRNQDRKRGLVINNNPNAREVLMKNCKIARAIYSSVFIIVCLMALPGRADAQAVQTGKTFDQIVELAKKEGEVRVATSWRRNNVPALTKGFREKYPMIEIKNTRVRGIASRERILNEAIGGVVEYDLVNVSGELRRQYIKADVLAGPIDWGSLYPNEDKVHFSPDGYFVASGFSRYVIAYNPTLVPKDKIPKKWDDCLDPYWKGKFVVLTRPRTFTGLYADWGEEKTIDFATRLKNNQPIWKGSQSGTLTHILAGEYPMVCGVGFHTVQRIMRRDSTAPLAFSVPPELPFNIGEAMAVMKGAKNPNAAVLLTGWLVSDEGQENYHLYGRSSPFTKGTAARKQVQESGAKIVWGGWDALDYEADTARKIIAAWGFPKVEK
jgi:iron(III) transport system substrate-binding protein